MTPRHSRELPPPVRPSSVYHANVTARLCSPFSTRLLCPSQVEKAQGYVVYEARPEAVNFMLDELVGGEFDLETNFIIQDAESIVCMVDLLEHCQVTCQAEIWSMFTAILRKSVRNLQTSTEVGLIQLVLLKMSSVDDMIAGELLLRATVRQWTCWSQARLVTLLEGLAATLLQRPHKVTSDQNPYPDPNAPQIPKSNCTEGTCEACHGHFSFSEAAPG
ncbi:hypothetical protein NFI96_006779 [Prochilodus magdalenae]|nr:hypothetical protein NFI96_006779 [Prochilodus magdalenae]